MQRLESTNAFVVRDLPGAASADGIVRCAKKVLVDSTRWLARSRTYSWALLGQQVSGASAAVNAVGDDRADALSAFCTELAPAVEAGELSLAAGKGVDEADLAALGGVVTSDAAAFAAGVTAAAGAVRSLQGATVAVEFDGGAGNELRSALEAAGAEVVADGSDALHADADVLLYGSKAALINHDTVEAISANVLVPTGNLALTPRALAVAGRAGKTVMADFLSTAGSLAARHDMEPAGTIGDLAARSLSHDDGPVLGACAMAEEYLSGWTAELPFGRPIG